MHLLNLALFFYFAVRVLEFFFVTRLLLLPNLDRLNISYFKMTYYCIILFFKVSIIVSFDDSEERSLGGRDFWEKD